MLFLTGDCTLHQAFFAKNLIVNDYRGSLEAINETDRSDYLKIVSSCLKTGFTYILSGFEYDSSCKPGPPRPLPPAIVSSLFQGVGDVSVLAKEEEEERRKKWNLTELHRYTYLIKNSN